MADPPADKPTPCPYCACDLNMYMRSLWASFCSKLRVNPYGFGSLPKEERVKMARYAIRMRWAKVLAAKQGKR